MPIVTGVNLSYSGQEKVQAPPAAVWAFISDPAQVARCLPRIEDVRVIDATHLQGHVSMGSGFMKSKIKLNIEVVPDQAQNRVNVKVTGGGLGSNLELTAGANILDNGDGTTTLAWQGNADMRGPLANMAGKMAEEQGQKMIARTFQNMSASIAQNTSQQA